MKSEDMNEKRNSLKCQPESKFQNNADTTAKAAETAKQKVRVIFIWPSIQKELVPLKIVLFCWYGAFSSLLPYMTVYLKQLGITASETAVIYTFFPIAKLLGPAVGGIISDKIRRYKPVLYVSLLCNIIFATSFLFIPSIPQKSCENMTRLQCSNQQPQIIIDSCCPEQSCSTDNKNATFAIKNCNLTCNEFISKKIHNHDICFTNNQLDYCISHAYEDMNKTTQFSLEYKTKETNSSCYYTIKNVVDASSNINIDTPFCYMRNITENCSYTCSVRTTDFPTNSVCKSTWDDRFPTLAIAFTIFFCFQIFVAICFSLIEATTLAMIKEFKCDYGRQRFWAILATAIFSPLTGALVDISSSSKGYTDYSPAFYLFISLVVVNIIILYVLNLSVAPPAKHIVKNLVNLIKMPEVVIFLIVIFLLGTYWGFLESFLFWHLLELGSPKYLLGLTLTVGAIVGLPFLHTSNWFVSKVGRVNLLILAFFFYFVRCVGYSYIYNPWWFVLFEAMEASTYHLMWVAAATYAASLAPKGLLATIQGCVAGMHYGIGRGSGSLIGGNLMGAFSTPTAFRSMGISSGCLGFLYAVIYYAFLRNLKKNKKEDSRAQTNEIPKDDVKTSKEEETEATVMPELAISKL